VVRIRVQTVGDSSQYLYKPGSIVALGAYSQCRTW
jgi:hypothetical protein